MSDLREKVALRRMYMNGRGIRRRTQRFNNAMWDAMGGAFAGGCCIIFGSIILAGSAILQLWPGFLLSAALIGGGYLLHRPWCRARACVVAHRKLMEAETRRYGKGWARS